VPSSIGVGRDGHEAIAGDSWVNEKSALNFMPTELGVVDSDGPEHSTHVPTSRSDSCCDVV
jgi:hypothetical protein